MIVEFGENFTGSIKMMSSNDHKPHNRDHLFQMLSS